MAQTELPVIGSVDRRWIYAAGFAVGGAVIWAYWRSSRAATPVLEEGDVAAEDLAYTPSAFEGARIPGGSTVVDESQPVPFTNADWSQRLLDMLESTGYQRGFIADTLGKYLSGSLLTVVEATLVRTAWALLGKPPQTPDLPILVAPTDQTPPASGVNHKYSVQLHKFSVITNARDAVRRYSDHQVATPNNIQTALARTMADPRNAKYLKYYTQHRGSFPAQSAVQLTVVKAA